MNYYNEFDPKAAAWLRELIKEGIIPNGHVDERSIADVAPAELAGFTQCHFFAGIGGWSEALRLAGWPSDKPVWTGSCPCQPFSSAGKQLGTADSRHLWPEFARLIKGCNPPVVFGEQVASAAGREWLAGVFADLEAMGYSRAGADLCAAGVGAPHIRQRLYWVGHSNGSEINSSISGQCVPGAGCDSSNRNGESVQGVGEVETCGLANTANERHGSIGNCASGCGEYECDCGVEYPYGGGLVQQPEQHCDKIHNTSNRSSCGEHPDGPGNTFRLGNTNEPGSQGRERAELPECSGEQTSRTRSLWSDYELIPCRDGKSRRTQPGLCPLAHGVSGRVGLLRGYGNAIVPQVAAEFIQAFCEATR